MKAVASTGQRQVRMVAAEQERFVKPAHRSRMKQIVGMDMF